MKSRIFTIALLALAALPLAAQVTVRRWADAVPAGPAHQLTNLNASTPYLGPATDLHLEFPIYSRRTTGAAQLDAVLVYDSQFWGVPSGSWAPQPGNGWWLRTNGGHLSESTYYQGGVCGWTDGDGTDDGSGSITTYSFSFTEPDGSVVNVGSYDDVYAPNRRHTEAEWNDCPNSDSLPKTWGTGDGKGFTVKVDTSGVGTAWDSHGDNVTNGFTDRNGNSVGLAGSSYYDPLGSTALVVSGSPATVVDYTYYGPGGVAETVIVPYESIPVTGSFGCYGGWSGSISVPSGITYPDGRVYGFTYDSAGRLATMTEPGGATVTYSHYLGVQCSPFYISDGFSQTDSLDPGLYWSWTHDTSSNQTIQRSPYGQDTVTTFDGSGNPTQVDVHSGLWNNSGILSRTVYSGSTYNRTSTSELCVSGTDPCGSTDSLKREAQHTVVLDGYGNVASTSDTDWGINAPGGMLRKTQNTYQASGNGEVLASAEVMDGGSNQAALTTFPSYDANGNPLTERDYTTSSAYLSTSFTYNANGTPASVTGPNGAVTTFTNYTCGPTGRQLFPQTITRPVVGATSATWDCIGGVETSATDLNGISTSTAFDNFWRPATVTTPMATTTISYPSVTRVERATTFNSGASTSDVLTVADALGRPILQQTRQAPGSGNFDSVQTTYDAMNRPVTVTMPYTAGAGGTAPSGTPYTQTWYDALSRPTKVVDGGGGEADYAYNLNDVLSTVVGTTGAPTVSRQEEMDGLGRLKSVCELTAGVTGWPAGSCGQATSASGYLTAYTRSTLGQITAVAQDSQPGNGGVENRGFSFDQLGRLTSETNPENGTVNYTLDTSSTCGVSSAGDLILRTDAAGNLTCYAHDALHRVTHIWYSGSSMNDKYFVYDAATVDGVAMLNVKGRLAEAHNGTTDLGFSYPSPATGETDLFQLSPNSGGWYTTISTAYPNGALASVALPSGLGISYGLDGEGRPATASANGSALVTTTTYSALGPTGVNFASGDSDSYGYDGYTGRMTQYQFNVNGQADTGVYHWNANGSQASLAITDAITGTADSQTCTYQHDDMGRLASSSCGGLWGQTYSFDPFGNMNKGASAGSTPFNATYNLKNQIASVGGSFTPNYDANGNLVDDPVAGTRGVNAFDLEGKPTMLESHSGIVVDALGRVVESGGEEFVYGPGGGKLAVMNGQTLVRADIPLPGGATAVFNAAGLAYYQHSDLLGSARLASTPGRTLYSSSAYAPFGENYAATGSINKVFTGQHQDIDSTTSGGQYDFLMREYSPAQSRWWTPDPAGLAAVDPNNPATWNRYTYGCDPLAAADPTGAAPTCTIDVHVENYSRLSQEEVSSAEQRANQIFAASPTAEGEVTQVNFVNQPGPGLLLQFMDPGRPGYDGQALNPGGPAQVFPGNVEALFARQGYSHAAQITGVGSTTAHELAHAISDSILLDLPYSGHPDLMNYNDALTQGLALQELADRASAVPTGFSRLSPTEAKTLYLMCFFTKLVAPRPTRQYGGTSDFSGIFYYSDPTCERCGPGMSFWYVDTGALSGAGQRPWGP